MCANCGPKLDDEAMIDGAANLMTCIVCMKMKPLRLGVGEHVIPLAIGGSFTIDRVCVDCDNRLGASADAGLIQLSAVEDRRAQLQLAGNAGVVPDPATQRYRGPLSEIGDDRHKIVLRRDRQTGEVTPKTLSRVEFDVLEVAGGLLIQPSAVFIDPSDTDKAEELARKALEGRFTGPVSKTSELSSTFRGNSARA
jgi:hypothetical protein